MMVEMADIFKRHGDGMMAGTGARAMVPRIIMVGPVVMMIMPAAQIIRVATKCDRAQKVAVRIYKRDNCLFCKVIIIYSAF